MENPLGCRSAIMRYICEEAPKKSESHCIDIRAAVADGKAHLLAIMMQHWTKHENSNHTVESSFRLSPAVLAAAR